MNLHINDFEGPLDLLLHLVKTAKMDIYEIDTAYIIDTYLEFINSLDKEDLDNASEETLESLGFDGTENKDLDYVIQNARNSGAVCR